MTLTGVPLLGLALALTLATGAATVRWWSRGGRWRPVTRTLGVLLVEALAVATAGLAFNRHEQFYPSWQALRGDTGTVAVTGHVAAGGLDHRLPPGPFPWRPAGLAAWHLAGPPLLTLPADYATRPDVTFPVVLDLVPRGTAARRTAEAVTVTAAPTARTNAVALRTLPAELRRALRVTAIGWDVVGGGRLGDALVRDGLAARDRSTDDLPPALAAPMRLPS